MAGRPIDEAVRAVATFLVADVPLRATLDQVAGLACAAVEPARAVGITLTDERGRPATEVFTDPVSPDVDAGQYEDGVGPCLDALRDGIVIRVDDTRTTKGRWPRYARDSEAAGVRSTLSVPLGAAGETFGAMNLYAGSPGAFTEEHEADALLFATQASVVLANARAYWAAFELAEGLRQAMDSRAVIEQAKGKLMAQTGRTPDEAFAMLVSASQRENVKLRDVARRIVEGAPAV
jgi:GAF domain-containing protein